MEVDSQLAEKIKEGNEEAFSQIYEKYSGPLLRHLVCMLGTREVAEEILHDVFMTMLRKVNFYVEDPSLRHSFRTWIFRIATNRAIDEIRRRKLVRFEALGPKHEEGGGELVCELSTRLEEVHQFVSRLPLLQRTYLSLKLENDLSHLEIARVCSCHVNSVKQGLFQARRSLKNMLLAQEVEL